MIEIKKLILNLLDKLSCRSKCCNIEVDVDVCEGGNMCERCGEHIECEICKGRSLCHACRVNNSDIR
jgi:hypothetical protein